MPQGMHGLIGLKLLGLSLRWLERTPDKGEAGGSSPPRPTILDVNSAHKDLIGFRHCGRSCLDHLEQRGACQAPSGGTSPSSFLLSHFNPDTRALSGRAFFGRVGRRGAGL